MSEPVKHNPTYTAADIQRYLKGDMSAREMHELEKAALEDPFLADAMEGFGASPETDQHLADLHERLDARVRTTNRKPILMPWMRIAAAVILLVGLSVTAWYTLLNKEHAPIAESKDRAIAPSTVVATPPVVTNTPPVVASPPAAENAAAPPVAKDKDSRVADGKQAPPRPAAQPAAAPDPSTEVAKADNPHKALESRVQGLAIQKETGTSRPNHQADTLSSQSFAKFDHELHATQIDSFGWYKKTRQSRPAVVFTGKVLDLHNNPIPNATLRFSGYSHVGTMTDNQGNFKMNVYPQDSVLRLTVDGIGYQEESLALNTINTEAAIGRIIHLKPSTSALDEVVVVGSGAKRKETRALAPFESNEKTDSAWLTVRPVIGTQAYKDYIEANKKMIGADSSVHGTVIISFNVSRKGELTAFKVEQSLTPAHDTGVIHLISDGPAWKVSKGRSAHTAVRVVF